MPPTKKRKKTDVPDRIVYAEDMLKDSIGSSAHTGGNGNVLNYVIIDDLPGKRIVGSIVNIAAYFHIGLIGVDIEAIAGLDGLAAYNKKLFGAGTVRVFLNLPFNFYTGDFGKDMELILHTNGIGSMEEFSNLLSCPKIKYPAQNLTGLLFDSGRIVLIGASNEYLARYGASLITYMLQKYRGIPAKFSNFRIVNIVTTFSLGFSINLDLFASEEGSLVSYKPHLFPAVMIPCPNNKMTLLVNDTGNCILTGSRDRQVLKEFFKEQYPIITKYRKNSRKEEDEQHMKNKTVNMNHGPAGRALCPPVSTPDDTAPAIENDNPFKLSCTTVVERNDTENLIGEKTLLDDLLNMKEALVDLRNKSAEPSTKEPEQKDTGKENTFVKACEHLYTIVQSLDALGKEEKTHQQMQKIGSPWSNTNTNSPNEQHQNNPSCHSRTPVILNRSIQKIITTKY